MWELLQGLAQVFVELWGVLLALAGVLYSLRWLLPYALWFIFWLTAVSWRRLWPILAQGGWAPAALLMVVSALAWSQLAPSSVLFLGVLPVPNFWWQLGWITVLVGLALFCGWLQGWLARWPRLNFAPPEIEIEPPAAPAHHHAHGHGHH